MRLRLLDVELAVELEFEARSMNLYVALAESRSFRNERLVRTRTARLVTTTLGVGTNELAKGTLLPG